VTKVLLSLAVVIVIIIAGGSTTHKTRVTETATDVAAIPDLPAISIAVPSPAAHPVDASGPLLLPTVGAPAGEDGSSSVSAQLEGDANAQVIDGTISSPQPATCGGMSHSKSSSENGRRAHTTVHHSHCSGDPESDDCSEGGCPDD